MSVWNYMEGYDRELDEDEFDARLWEYMHEDEFEFDGAIEEFLKAYGLGDVHIFLKIIRVKKEQGIIES